jgi:hypothetical protein
MLLALFSNYFVILCYSIYTFGGRIKFGYAFGDEADAGPLISEKLEK